MSDIEKMEIILDEYGWVTSIRPNPPDDKNTWIWMQPKDDPLGGEWILSKVEERLDQDDLVWVPTDYFGGGKWVKR